MRFIIAAILFFSFTATSCSIHLEKRHYRNGFYFTCAKSGGGEYHEEYSDACSKLRTEESVSAITADTMLSNPIDPIQSFPSPGLMGRSTTFIDTTCKSRASPKKPDCFNKPLPENDPIARKIKKTKIMGILALVFVVFSIILLELASGFILPILSVGFGLAFIGLLIGRDALAATKYKVKSEDGTMVPNPLRRQAKQAYWLCLSAILLMMAYVIVRFASVVGLGPIGLAFTLLGIGLALFLLFRMGIFTDLAD